MSVLPDPLYTKKKEKSLKTLVGIGKDAAAAYFMALYIIGNITDSSKVPWSKRVPPDR